MCRTYETYERSAFVRQGDRCSDIAIRAIRSLMRPLFPDFANLWVAACRERDLKRDQPFPLILGGERLVLFRDASGWIATLIDRCPHRGVALSLGTLDQGELTCPFHGWRFGGDGQCLHVPWNPAAKRGNLSATALPTRTLGGLIWVFTGLEATTEPTVPDIFRNERVRLTSQEFVWESHWTRVMENMLDMPHLPFVHARTIGRSLRGLTDAAMEMSWQDTPSGGVIASRRDGVGTGARLRFHFPNMMELEIDPQGRTLRLIAVCNPQATGRTRLTIYTARSFARWPIMDPLFARANARIAAEDRAIVESSDPSEVPAAAEENSVATDAPTLAFRKIWFNRIKGSSTSAD